MKLFIWILVAQTCWMTTGCSSTVRFKDQPVVWNVDDDLDIPEPEEAEFLVYRYFADIFLFKQLPRALDLRDRESARNTNALDEVPDSAWFTNRIGVRDLTAEEIIEGPNRHGMPALPLTVVKGKVGGGNPGFVVKDARGINFLVKFDTKNNPEMQTAAGIITNRILWAVGYNVPSDHVFWFRREDLHVDPAATFSNELREKQPLTRELVDEVLETSPKQPDGSFRALASEYLDGKPKGGAYPEGVRSDDPNDTVPHEHRRDLRALRVFAAWLNHSDMKEDNTLDVYVNEDGRRFIRHYLLDFGESLGGHVAEKGRYQDGWEYYIDWTKIMAGWLSFGLWKRSWEETKETPWLSVGSFSDEPFDPAAWQEAYPYWPFWEMDAADAYWGAKLVMRFDRSLLEAVVAEGGLSHPYAAAHIGNALLGRARKIGKTWLEAVTPLDAFRVDSRALCAVDLGVYYNLATSGVVERLDEDDEVLGEYTVEDSGRVCLPMTAGDDYRIDRLRIRRGTFFKPVMQVHYKGGDGARILGVIRVEPW